jgi:hypothetical protein
MTPAEERELRALRERDAALARVAELERELGLSINDRAKDVAHAEELKDRIKELKAALREIEEAKFGITGLSATDRTYVALQQTRAIARAALAAAEKPKTARDFARSDWTQDALAAGEKGE